MVSARLLEVASDNSWMMPGDCVGVYADRRRLTLTEERTARVEIPIECLIRLTAPQDTGEVLPRDSPEQTSPVTFAWKPVPGAQRYHYRLTDGEHVMAEGDTRETTWTTPLDPSLPRAQYRLTLSAHGEHGQLGRLKVFTASPTGQGTSESRSYDFRVAGWVLSPGNGHVVIVPTYDRQPHVRLRGGTSGRDETG